jgi:hypothetical protein
MVLYGMVCRLVFSGKERLLSENNLVIDVCHGDVCFLKGTCGIFKCYIEELSARNDDG